MLVRISVTGKFKNGKTRNATLIREINKLYLTLADVDKTELFNRVTRVILDRRKYNNMIEISVLSEISYISGKSDIECKIIQLKSKEASYEEVKEQLLNVISSKIEYINSEIQYYKNSGREKIHDAELFRHC